MKCAPLLLVPAFWSTTALPGIAQTAPGIYTEADLQALRPAPRLRILRRPTPPPAFEKGLLVTRVDDAPAN